MSQHFTFSCIVISILQLEILYLTSTNLQKLSNQIITEILLYGNSRLSDIQNCIISKFAIMLWILKDLLALYFRVEISVFIKNMT